MRSLLPVLLLVLVLPVAAQDVITPGSDLLDLDRLHDDEATFSVTVRQGTMEQNVGTVTRRIMLDNKAGEAVFITEMTMMGNKFADTTRTDWPALTTRMHSSDNPQRHLRYEIADGALAGEHTPAGGNVEMFEASVDGPIFDSSMIGTLASLLPLADGYVATVPAYEHEADGMTDYTITVLGSDKLVVGGREPVDVWIVEANWEGGTQVPHYYYAKEGGKLVRIRIEPQPGIEVFVDAQ